MVQTEIATSEEVSTFKLEQVVNPTRILTLHTPSSPSTKGPVIYWMSREQRTRDNWALLYAQQMASKHSGPVIVVFNLSPGYLGATKRAYGFMLRGLEVVERNLKALGIPLFLTIVRHLLLIRMRIEC